MREPSVEAGVSHRGVAKAVASVPSRSSNAERAGPEARPLAASVDRSGYQLLLLGQPALPPVSQVRLATPAASVMVNLLPVFESTASV